MACGKDRLKKWGYTGFEQNTEWCFKSFPKFFEKVQIQEHTSKTMRLIRDSRDFGLIGSKRMKKIKYPVWFRKLRKLIKSPVAKTVEGWKNIQKVLTKHKAKVTPQKLEKIRSAISTDNINPFIELLKKLKKLFLLSKNYCLNLLNGSKN